MHSLKRIKTYISDVSMRVFMIPICAIIGLMVFCGIFAILIIMGEVGEALIYFSRGSTDTFISYLGEKLGKIISLVIYCSIGYLIWIFYDKEKEKRKVANERQRYFNYSFMYKLGEKGVPMMPECNSYVFNEYERLMKDNAFRCSMHLRGIKQIKYDYFKDIIDKEIDHLQQVEAFLYEISIEEE